MRLYQMIEWILCFCAAIIVAGTCFYDTYKHVVMARSEEDIAASRR